MTYQAMINNIKIPEPDGAGTNIVVQGSYKFKKEPRIINKLNDGDGVTHYFEHEKPRVTISFSIKERTQDEQESVTNLFSLKDIHIEYWDPYNAGYRTGVFRLETPELPAPYVEDGTIYYGETTLIYVEK